MPPSSKSNDVETLCPFMRPFTPLPPVDRVPCHFAAPPRREMAGSEFSSGALDSLVEGASLFFAISQVPFRVLDEQLLFFDQPTALDNNF